jgi:DUF1365 family protein
MNSIFLSHGSVLHARHGEKKNSFRYPVFNLVLPISEENQVIDIFKRRFCNVLTLGTQDFLQEKKGSLEQAAKTFLKEKCDYEAEEIWLQTFPRMFGYVFNPITFWFCKKNGNLDAVLCEVRNTFGEKHFYWVKSNGPIQADQWLEAQKVFHVSPFYPVDGYYKFRFHLTLKNSRVDISYFGDDHILRLTTWVAGTFQNIQQVKLINILWRYGWMTTLVIFRIHWQALRLFIKKVKFFSKPEPPTTEIT